MNYATIGTSWITQSYILAAQSTGKWQLHAVFSRQKETALAFAEKNNVKKIYTDLCALADDPAIEAVYIASPNSLHFEQSKQMLLAGKHVLCEKPATVTQEEYKTLKALADSKGLIYMEAIMSLHVPALPILKEALQKTGRITSASVRYCQLSSKYPALQSGKLPNIFNPTLCTGALMDLGVYNLYLIAALFGMPEEIISHSHFLPTGADETTTAIFKYKDFPLTLTCSKTGQGYAPTEITGDRGSICIDSISQLTGIVFTDEKTKQQTQLVAHEPDRTQIMCHEAEAFYRFITDKNTAAAYEDIHNTANLVRRMCDSIRKNNHFTF